MGDARTHRTGSSKLLNKHPIHVMVDEEDYREFHAWCMAHGTTPTSYVREMVRTHNQKHRKRSLDEKIIERAAHLKGMYGGEKCVSCKKPFDKGDVDGGRCRGCGTMISTLTLAPLLSRSK